MDATFALVYNGEVSPGHNPRAVRQGLETLLDLDNAQCCSMERGEPVVLSSGMDEATAQAFQQVLKQAGAITEILPDDGTGSANQWQEKRSVRRRIQAMRRAQVRGNAIVPDRRSDERRESETPA